MKRNIKKAAGSSVLIATIVIKIKETLHHTCGHTKRMMKLNMSVINATKR